MKKSSRPDGGSRVLGATDESFSDLRDRGMMGTAWMGVTASSLLKKKKRSWLSLNPETSAKRTHIVTCMPQVIINKSAARAHLSDIYIQKTKNSSYTNRELNPSAFRYFIDISRISWDRQEAIIAGAGARQEAELESVMIVFGASMYASTSQRLRLLLPRKLALASHCSYGYWGWCFDW